MPWCANAVLTNSMGIVQLSHLLLDIMHKLAVSEWRLLGRVFSYSAPAAAWAAASAWVTSWLRGLDNVSREPVRLHQYMRGRPYIRFDLRCTRLREERLTPSTS